MPAIRLPAIPFINASDFGAKGDNSTDDAAAIQAALNYAEVTLFAGSAGGTVYLHRGIFMIGSQIIIPARCRLIGQGPLVTEIRATTGFATNTPLVRLGRSTDNAPECTTLEQVRVLAVDIAGSTCVYSNGINEVSGVFDCVLQGYRKYGIWVEFTGVQPPADCSFERIHLLSSTSGATAGIFLDTLAGEGLLKNISVVSAGGPGGGGALTDAGIRTTTTGSLTMLGIHCESCTNGIDITGSNSAGTIIGFSGSSTNTNCMTFRSGTGKWSVIRAENKGETATIVDVQKGVTVTGNVSYYAQDAPSTTGKGDFSPVGGGYKFWNFDPLYSNGNGTILTDGTVYVTRIDTPGPSQACTTVSLGFTVAGTSLTTALLGVYGPTGTQLALSSSQTTSWNTGTGLKSVTGLSFNTPADSYIDIVWVTSGGTQPTLLRANGSAAGIANLATGQPQRRFATNLTGQTSLPTPLVQTSNVPTSIGYWAAIT